jgi:hypothetical protein
MTQNVGGIDRILRVVVGLVLIGLAATDNIGVWGYIGVVPLLTGLFRYCPAYSIFGCKTGASCGTGCGTGCKTDCK